MSTFSQKHYSKIAKFLGNLSEPDEFVQILTERFGQFFLGDNERFNFKRFQSAVTREREGTYNEKK